MHLPKVFFFISFLTIPGILLLGKFFPGNLSSFFLENNSNVHVLEDELHTKESKLVRQAADSVKIKGKLLWKDPSIMGFPGKIKMENLS